MKLALKLADESLRYSKPCSKLLQQSRRDRTSAWDESLGAVHIKITDADGQGIHSHKIILSKHVSLPVKKARTIRLSIALGDF